MRKEVYVSYIGGKPKYFEKEKDFLLYEESLKDFRILSFIIENLRFTSNKDKSVSYRIDKSLIIKGTITTYDNWDGRPPLTDYIEYKDIQKFFDRYSSLIEKFINELNIIKTLKDNFDKYQDNVNVTLCEDFEFLDKLVENIKLREEALIFIERFGYENQN